MNKNSVKSVNTFSGQARELKVRARIEELEKALIASEEDRKAKTKQIAELREANIYLNGQVNAYEKVLSHMIYNSSNTDECDDEDTEFANVNVMCDGDCENCEFNSEVD